MASEISVSVAVSLTRTQTLANWVTGVLSSNQTGSRSIRQVQNVLTTAAVLQIGSIGTLGYLMIRNLDTSTNNEVYLMDTTGGNRIGRLSSGEVMLIKIGPDITTPAVKALSTATQIECMIFEL